MYVNSWADSVVVIDAATIFSANLVSADDNVAALQNLNGGAALYVNSQTGAAGIQISSSNFSNNELSSVNNVAGPSDEPSVFGISSGIRGLKSIR